MGEVTFELDRKDENNIPITRTLTIDDNTEALILSNRELVRIFGRLAAQMRAGK